MVPENVRLGKNCWTAKNVSLGVPSREYANKKIGEIPLTKIGDGAVIRSGTVIYCDVVIGKNFQTGHNVLVRERTSIGDDVLVGTNSVIEGNTEIGSRVSVQSIVYIPMHTRIEDRVFIGPNAVLANDKYPLRIKKGLSGPVLRKGCTIGANATILPGVEVGEGGFVAAGSVVTKDVPPWKLAVGAPARVKDLPEELRVLNFPED
ncbi:MAG: DapH/DapD/GlmU-related protein [Candidatus Hydrothermarchaeales archaeon]